MYILYVNINIFTMALITTVHILAIANYINTYIYTIVQALLRMRGRALVENAKVYFKRIVPNCGL